MNMRIVLQNARFTPVLVVSMCHHFAAVDQQVIAMPWPAQGNKVLPTSSLLSKSVGTAAPVCRYLEKAENMFSGLHVTCVTPRKCRRVRYAAHLTAGRLNVCRQATLTCVDE